MSSVLESLFFAVGEDGLSIEELESILEIDEEKLNEELDILKKLYEKEDIPKESDNSSTLTKANKEKKKTSKDKLVELCKDVIAQESENRDKVNNILKKYEPQKGMISKFKVQQVKEAIEEIEKLKK